MAAGREFPIGKLVKNSINITGVLEGTISFTYNGEQLSGKYGGTDVYVFTK